MPATKRFMNWTGVSFTPAGGSPTSITGVTRIGVDNNGTLESFAGDGDRYNTTVVNSMNAPMVTIQTADVTLSRAWAVGTRGVLEFTLNDARNGTGTGALSFSVSTAVLQSPDANAQHRQYGQTTLQFGVESADGTTNPVSTTIAV